MTNTEMVAYPVGSKVLVCNMKGEFNSHVQWTVIGHAHKDGVLYYRVSKGMGNNMMTFNTQWINVADTNFGEV